MAHKRISKRRNFHRSAFFFQFCVANVVIRSSAPLYLTSAFSENPSYPPFGYEAVKPRCLRSTENRKSSRPPSASSCWSWRDARGRMCSSRKILWSLLLLSVVEVGLGVASIVLGAVGISWVRGQHKPQQGDASPVWSGLCVRPDNNFCSYLP